MARASVIELHQVRHALKVAAVTGQAPLRDVAFAVLYSTGITPHEAAPLVVSDYLAEDGSARVDSALRPETTRTSAVSYSCETLNEVIRRLHTQAGIASGSASAARRTFAVNLHRQGRSPKLIKKLIGVSSLAAVKRLVDVIP